MIPDSVVEEIKYRNNIEDVISSYVTLKNAGSNMNGLCPFHSEKTPSFTVFTKSSSYYCFGCGAGGDVITFIMHMENLDYVGALEFLAKRVGIEIPSSYHEKDDGVKRSRIFEMNRDAAKYFFGQLPRYPEALEYVKKRNLSAATIKHFGIGYAPPEFGALTNHLRSLGYSEKEMVAGFLCGISKKTGRLFDYFRGRLIFPIIDVSSNVIGFGGRSIDGSEPKYLNTSDTPAFKKSKNLFALNFAKSKCSGRMILCEGYMDVISLHAAGFEEAVATLGTALTEEQARIMNKYTKTVIISYDSDQAGQRAADRAFKLLHSAGVEAKILKMTGAKDPDEYIVKFGREAFSRLIEASNSEFEYRLGLITEKYNIMIPEEKIQAANEISQFISGCTTSVERDVYIGKAASELGVQSESLKSDVEKLRSKTRYVKKREDAKKFMQQSAGIGDRIDTEKIKNLRASGAEAVILGILMVRPELARKIIEKKISLSREDFSGDFNRRVFGSILAHTDEAGSFDIGVLNGEYTAEEMSRIIKYTVERDGIDNNETILLESIKTLSEATHRGEMSIEELLQSKRKGNDNGK